MLPFGFYQNCISDLKSVSCMPTGEHRSHLVSAGIDSEQAILARASATELYYHLRSSYTCTAPEPEDLAGGGQGRGPGPTHPHSKSASPRLSQDQPSTTPAGFHSGQEERHQSCGVVSQTVLNSPPIQILNSPRPCFLLPMLQP